MTTWKRPETREPSRAVRQRSDWKKANLAETADAFGTKCVDCLETVSLVNPPFRRWPLQTNYWAWAPCKVPAPRAENERLWCWRPITGVVEPRKIATRCWRRRKRRVVSASHVCIMIANFAGRGTLQRQPKRRRDDDRRRRECWGEVRGEVNEAPAYFPYLQPPRTADSAPSMAALSPSHRSWPTGTWKL